MVEAVSVGRAQHSGLARYSLGEMIGQGALAQVFAARDTLLGREVAVKIFVSTADDPERLRLQEAEARLAAGLNHHALTTLFDAGVDRSSADGPRIYLVMERIDGGDLRERLRQGPLSAVQVAYLGFDLADALHYVHQHGFLHRDIKPANVLLGQRGASTRLRGKLTDFGISSIIGAAHDRARTEGTVAYISPEQVRGDEPTPASETYSLGLVLLEALTARVEFPGTVEESLSARLQRDPLIPPSIPAQLGRTIRAMTVRDPARRISLADALERFQDYCIVAIAESRNAPAVRLLSDEPGRVSAVRRYNVLDTPPEPEFDRLTRLAARLLRVPIAFLGVIDADRVWFKSRRGLELEEVSRDSLRIGVTAEPEGATPWTIPDLRAHETMQHHDLVVGPTAARSYAAAPLVTAEGQPVGIIGVLDVQPRRFTPDDFGDLTDLAAIAMRELELRRTTREAIFYRH